MKSLDRNKRYIYYSNLVGEQEIVDEYGNVTGEMIPLYGDTHIERMNESAARGNAYDDPFGIGTSYNKTLVTNNLSLPIDKTTRLWLGFGKVEQFSDTETYAEGDIVIKNNALVKAQIKDGAIIWNAVPYNYIVVGVAKSLNSVSYAVREVQVNG